MIVAWCKVCVAPLARPDTILFLRTIPEEPALAQACSRRDHAPVATHRRRTFLNYGNVLGIKFANPVGIGFEVV